MINKRTIQAVSVIVLLVAIALGFFYRDIFNVALLEQWVNKAGFWAPLLFILIYTTATVLFLPGSILTLAGGVLFGPIFGSLYNLTGATIGAAMSFLIARYISSEMVAKRSGGKLNQLINGVENEGWRFVAFVRLVPLFPFNLLNYALGLTKIRFVEYLLATFVFMMPGAIAYTYIGFAGREAIGGGNGIIQTVLIALALLAAVAFLPRFVATVRKGPSIDVIELKRRVDQGETVVLDIRSEKNFVKDGHIDQALNIPMESLEQNIDRLKPYLKQSISIVGQSDKCSTSAANLLFKHEFENVRIVEGGMSEWTKLFSKRGLINSL